MKRKLIKISLLIVVFATLTFLIQKVVSKTVHKQEVLEMLESIPEFSFTTLGQVRYTKNDLTPGKATVFIYFNSTCDYCQHEAQDIAQNISEFSETQLVFVSTEPLEVIERFAKSYGLLDHENVDFVQDPNWTFATEFDAVSIPFLLIYDETGTLVKRHKGQIKAENLLKALQY